MADTPNSADNSVDERLQRYGRTLDSEREQRIAHGSSAGGALALRRKSYVVAVTALCAAAAIIAGIAFIAIRAENTKPTGPRVRIVTPTTLDVRTCPATIPTRNEDQPLPTTPPHAALICSFVKTNVKSKDLESAPAELGTIQATTLANMIRSMPIGTFPSGCGTPKPDTLIRFSYSNGTIVDALATAVACDPRIIVVNGQPHVASGHLGTYILTVNINSSIGRAQRAPDLSGLTMTQAAKVAKTSGFTVRYLEGVRDDARPAETIILQNPPPGHSGLGKEIEVTIALHKERVCTLHDLAIDFEGGGAGAGNNFGSGIVRNTSATPCEIAGSVVAVGVDAHGKVVTSSVSRELPRPTVLTTRTTPLVNGQAPLGTNVLRITLVAEYRDDPAAANGICEVHLVIPAQIRFTFDVGSFTAPNSPPTEMPDHRAFATCYGTIHQIEAQVE